MLPPRVLSNRTIWHVMISGMRKIPALLSIDRQAGMKNGCDLTAPKMNGSCSLMVNLANKDLKSERKNKVFKMLTQEEKIYYLNNALKNAVEIAHMLGDLCQTEEGEELTRQILQIAGDIRKVEGVVDEKRKVKRLRRNISVNDEFLQSLVD